jgi:hypothetical protein
LSLISYCWYTNLRKRCGARAKRPLGSCTTKGGPSRTIPSEAKPPLICEYHLPAPWLISRYAFQEIAFRWSWRCVDSDVQLYGNFETATDQILAFFAALLTLTVPCLFVIAVGQASDQEALVTTAQTSEWHATAPFAAR